MDWETIICVYFFNDFYKVIVCKMYIVNGCLVLLVVIRDYL